MTHAQLQSAEEQHDFLAARLLQHSAGKHKRLYVAPAAYCLPLSKLLERKVLGWEDANCPPFLRKYHSRNIQTSDTGCSQGSLSVRSLGLRLEAAAPVADLRLSSL